jgi:hypothetical protein
LLLTFMEACVRGRLPFEECSPVYQMAVIAVFLLVAVAVLAVLMRRGAQGR